MLGYIWGWILYITPLGNMVRYVKLLGWQGLQFFYFYDP